MNVCGLSFPLSIQLRNVTLHGISGIDRGESKGTHAMTRHAKCVTMTRICTYLRSKTKSVTVGFVCSDGVSNATLNVQLFGTRAIGRVCQIACVRKDT